MNEFTIHRRISEILNDGGFRVIASEVDEGFPKPAVFVTVTPVSHERLMCGMERVTDNVELEFVPSAETALECTRAADRIINLLYYSPFTVEGHCFTVERIETEIDNYILYVNFEISYEQEMPYDEDDEIIKEMEMNFDGNA